MSQIQIRNDQMVDLLMPDFQARYEPNFSWKSVCSQYLALPGLRGFWPLSSFDSNGDAYDLSGQGRTLTANGATLNYNLDDLRWWSDYTTATPDYHERADEAGLDILGTETYVNANAQGITFGAWVRFDAAAAAVEFILSKQDGAAAVNVAYSLSRTAAGILQAQFSSGALLETQNSANAMAATTWYFAAGRWIPSTDRSVFLNNVRTDAGASAIAALQNHTANLQLAGRDNGAGGSTLNLDGRICLAFLCATALSDSMVWSLFQQSRAMFGV